MAAISPSRYDEVTIESADGKSTTILIETFSAHQKARTNESLGANLSDGNHSANATAMETGFSMCNGFIRNMVAKNVVKRAEKNIEDIETCAALDVLRDCDACNDVGCFTEACLNPLTNAQKELKAGQGASVLRGSRYSG